VEDVRIVLEVLRKHKLYAKLPKCSFMQSELKFLGHIVEGWSPKRLPLCRTGLFLLGWLSCGHSRGWLITSGSL